MCHKEAVFKWKHCVRGVDINLQLQRQLVAEQLEARNCLHKMFTTVEYLAQQALPFRGHEEERGNLYQLLKVRTGDSDVLNRWLQKRSYTSHDVPNEILRIMAHQIQQSMFPPACGIVLSADETVDVSLTEQVNNKL